MSFFSHLVLASISIQASDIPQVFFFCIVSNGSHYYSNPEFWPYFREKWSGFPQKESILKHNCWVARSLVQFPQICWSEGIFFCDLS